jgi:hypothetical protein
VGEDHLQQSKHDKTLLEAVYYLAYKSWDITDFYREADSSAELSASMVESERLFSGALEKLLQATSDGDLTIWGEKNVSGSRLVALPADYWATATIRLENFMIPAYENRPNEIRTEPIEQWAAIDSYLCLKVTKSEVEKLWPVEST